MSVHVVSPAQLRVSTGTVSTGTIAPAQLRTYPIGYGLAQAQFDFNAMMNLMMSMMQMVLMLVFVMLPIQLMPKIFESIKV